MSYRVKSKNNTYLYFNWEYGRYGNAHRKTYLSKNVEKATIFTDLDEAKKCINNYNRTHNRQIDLEVEEHLN